MQYRDFSLRRNNCLPTATGEASIGSSSLFTESTSRLSPDLRTIVVPLRSTKYTRPDAVIGDKAWLEHDSDLDSIRQEPRYLAMMRAM